MRYQRHSFLQVQLKQRKEVTSNSMLNVHWETGINTPDHDAQFLQISDTLLKNNTRERANFVSLIQSKDCSNLKSMMKSMMEQFLAFDTAQEEAKIRAQYDEVGEEDEEIGEEGQRSTQVAIGKKTVSA